jgi:phosphoenolpyruvate carboxykinase (GTP)
MNSNPNAMLTLAKNSIFTNTGLTTDYNIWWEEMTDTPPANLTDWLRRPWTPDSDRKASHPNARFTTPARQCPVISPEFESQKGVPISAILFGGRREGVIPLVNEALNWQHGVFLGSIMNSEKTAAAAGKVGELRFDPFAMLPFCGYNMGDYFAHWLKIGAKGDADKLPKLYYVNWFRKNDEGKFMWPGFGENSRVLKWVFDRVTGKAEAMDTAIGRLPAPGALDTTGLKVSDADMKKLLNVDVDGWTEQLPAIKKHYEKFGAHLPKSLKDELEALEARLKTGTTANV